MAKMFSNFFGQSQSDSELPQEEKDSNEIKNTDSVSPDRLDVMEDRIKVLENRVAELEAFIHKHQDTVTVDKPKVEETEAVEAPVVDHQPHTISYYLAAPNPDGTFSDISKSEQIGKSIYQLTTSDEISGNFIMLDTHDAIATAMISVSQFVKPVCKVKGAVSTLPRHIVTEEEGVAVKEGEIWRVKNKAVIRME